MQIHVDVEDEEAKEGEYIAFETQPDEEGENKENIQMQDEENDNLDTDAQMQQKNDDVGDEDKPAEVDDYLDILNEIESENKKMEQEKLL